MRRTPTRLAGHVLATGLATGLALTMLAWGTPAAPASAAVSASVTAAGTATPTEGTSPDPGSADRRALLQQRLSLACARIPNAVVRTENLQARLAGDAATRGSLEWLSARIADAEARGNSDLATVLNSRLAVRQELAELLPLRLTALATAQETCTEAGL